MREREAVVVSGDAETVKRESARRTRRSFVVGAAAGAAGYGLLRWINDSRPVGELQSALRGSLENDASIDRTVFDYRGLAPTYPLSEARPLRLNGVIGLRRELDVASWRLQLAGVANAESSPLYVKDVTAWQYKYADEAQAGQPTNDVKIAPRGGKSPMTGKTGAGAGTGAGGAAGAGTGSGSGAGTGSGTGSGLTIAERFDRMTQEITHKRYQGDAEAGASANSLDIGTPGLLLAMDDLMKLPKVSFVTQFKCIEGWSVITQWGGVRLRDLIDAYPPARTNGREPRYVYMETPDGNFYGGYDMAAARHPQSLLVTEMSGQPLTQVHGAPLRLHMPIKYGYKQIKRIGLIAYTDSKPDDFWTKLGYDWYAGL